MDMIALIGIGIIAAILAVMLRKTNPEMAIVISLAASILILFIIITKAVPIIDEIRTMIQSAGINIEFGSVLFKALGICFLTQFAADSCADAGEKAMGSKIELAGKISIVALSLPLFKEIMSFVTSLIGGAT
jgi:stage III sporulation protein AD